jgi:hypothetical protein
MESLTLETPLAKKETGLEPVFLCLEFAEEVAG